MYQELLILSLPNLVEFDQLNTLGVINVTPNSFSDQNFFLNKKNLKLTLENFKSIKGLVFDFGFESTAPMNQAISSSLEIERFDAFFEEIKDINLSGHWISFDTYRPQNYLYFEEKFKARYQDCRFIFNDVSGVLDPEIVLFLKSKRSAKHFYYIHTYTYIPSRDLVLDHMKFIQEGNIEELAYEHFLRVFKIFKDIQIEDKIIFDPGFGFSKSYEQNWNLLNNLDKLVNKLELVNVKKPWLIGVSKKSFLRKSLVNILDPFKDSEILHLKIIKELTIKKLGHLLFRAHDPNLVKKALV